MKKCLSVALVAAMGLAPAAQAEVRFSGFGQVVAGKTSGSSGAFPARKYGESVSFRQESLIGVQVDADLGSRMTGTVQVIAKGEQDFEPELAWAYLNVQLGKGFSTKIGRQRLPFYRYSDFLDVGYAYPWIRPPVAMYNQPWSNADGVSLSHATYLGKWFSQAQVIYGEFAGEANIGRTHFRGELDPVMGASWDMEYDEWLSVRAAYLRGDVTITGTSLDQVTNALRSFRQNALADRIAYNDDTGTFKSVGFKVDKAGWLVIGEYARLDIENSVFDGIGRTDWYATVGHRFGPVTPHVTYGRRTAGTNTSLLAGIPTASPLYRPVAAAAASQRLDETFQSVGVRWDVASKIALKADYTTVESDIPGASEDDLLSAGVTFTF